MPRCRKRDRQLGRDPRLADAGSGAGDHDGRHWWLVISGTSPNTSAECGDESVDLRVGVRGAHRDPQPGGAGRDRRRPDRGHDEPVFEEHGGGVDRELLLAAHERQDRRRVAGPQPVDVRAQARDERVAFGRAQDPKRGERGRGVGGRRRGREDVRPARVLDELDVTAGPGDEPAERAEGLRAGADAQHVGIGLDVDARAQHGVGLVEHEQRVFLAQSSISASTSAASPSIENTVSLTTSARRPPCDRAGACAEVIEVAVAVHRRVGGASRQPSMIDAWLSSSEQTSTPAVPNVVSTPRFAANPVGKSAARSVPFHAASSRSSSLWIGRDPTMRRAEPAPLPQRSSASCAAAITAGCEVSPR